jgi:hypothetical protein
VASARTRSRAAAISLVIVPAAVYTNRRYTFDEGTDASTITTGDTGSGDPFDGVTIGVGNSVEYDTAVRLHGKASARVFTDTNNNGNFYWSLLEEPERFYVCIYSRLTTVGSLLRIVYFLQGNNSMGGARFNTSRVLAMLDDAGAVITGSTFTTIPNLGEWFRLEVYIEPATGGWELRLFTGADLESATPTESKSGTGASFTSGGTLIANRVRFGSVGNAHEFYIDSAAVSTGSWLGPWRPLRYRSSSRAAAISTVTTTAAASARSSSRAAATSTVTAGTVTVTAAATARSSSRAAAISTVTTTAVASARTRPRALAAGLGLALGAASERGRSRALAAGLGLALGAASARGRSRALGTSLRIATASASARGQARSLAASSSITTAAAASARSSSRVIAISTVGTVTVVTAAGGSRSAPRALAAASGITTTAVASARTRPRALAAGLGLALGAASARARTRSPVAASSITTTAVGRSRTTTRAPLITLALTTAVGRDRGHARDAAVSGAGVLSFVLDLGRAASGPDLGRSGIGSREVASAAVTADIG